jgi:hypothetical protein
MEIATNPKRSRRRKYRRNGRRHGRRTRRNPGLVGNITGSVGQGFKLGNLTEGAVLVGGAVGNGALTGIVSRYLPGMLTSGWGSYATGLAMAGITSQLVGMLAPKYKRDVFMGGMLQVLLQVYNNELAPKLSGLDGLLGDYLTQPQAADARPLGYLGDYLTQPQAADARPLGDLNAAADLTVSEVLAADGLSGSLV